MSDRSEYTDSGHRGDDPREGFGDDMGTRVGRPDEAPRDASPGQRPGQVSTNDEAVAGGLEGSIEEEEGSGQRRVQNASRDVNPDPAADNDRRIDDL